MKAFDVFSGGGGFRAALDKTGIKTIAHCEIDKWAHKFYTQAFETESEQYFNDATKLISTELPDFDLLCAGFPCQSFSIAGKRQGFNDPRGTMFFELARILKDKRPRYFLFENVKGLLTHDNGKTFQTILEVLANLGLYSIEWMVLNSKDFGVPQNRERVFIVGYPRKYGVGKIFPLGTTTKLCSQRGKNKEEIYNIAQTLKVRDYANWGGNFVVEGISPTLTTNKGEGIKIASLRSRGKKGLRFMKENISSTLPGRARNDGSELPVVLIDDYNANVCKDNIAPTVRENFRNSASRNGCELFQKGIIRRLTPLECFRLQGFPDEVFLKGSKDISDAQLYKIAGNAVTVNVVYEILKRIVEVDKK